MLFDPILRIRYTLISPPFCFRSWELICLVSSCSCGYLLQRSHWSSPSRTWDSKWTQRSRLDNLLTNSLLTKKEIVLIESENRIQYKYDAIYILQPTQDNVQSIIYDFIDPQNRRYGAARIHFIDGADDRLIDELTRGPTRSVLREMKELYLDFNPSESMVFTTRPLDPLKAKSSSTPRTSDSFQILYNSSCQSLVDRELALIAKKVSISRSFSLS